MRPVFTTSPVWIRTWTALRAVTAALIVAAVVAQAVRTFTQAGDRGQDEGTVVANFFSFFTILSNCAAAIVLAWAVGWALRSRSSAMRSEGPAGASRDSVEPRSLAVCLVSVSTYMIITGVVYNLLLRGVNLEPGTTVAWSNEVLHSVGPAFLALDVALGPFRRRLDRSAVLATLIFPVVWIAYTLLRGPHVVNPRTGASWWYPYPFLDPHSDGGWPSVWFHVAGIAAGIVAVALLVVAVGRVRTRDVMPETAGATA